MLGHVERGLVVTGMGPVFALEDCIVIWYIDGSSIDPHVHTPIGMGREGESMLVDGFYPIVGIGRDKEIVEVIRDETLGTDFRAQG